MRIRSITNVTYVFFHSWSLAEQYMLSPLIDYTCFCPTARLLLMSGSETSFGNPYMFESHKYNLYMCTVVSPTGLQEGQDAKHSIWPFSHKLDKSKLCSQHALSWIVTCEDCSARLPEYCGWSHSAHAILHSNIFKNSKARDIHPLSSINVHPHCILCSSVSHSVHIKNGLSNALKLYPLKISVKGPNALCICNWMSHNPWRIMDAVHCADTSTILQQCVNCWCDTKTPSAPVAAKELFTQPSRAWSVRSTELALRTAWD